MSSRIIEFTGTSMWARVNSPDPTYGNYSIGVDLDPKSQEEFEASGLQMRPKREDGKYLVTFRRPVNKTINGELVEFGPPSVSGIDDGVLIGNGSGVKVTVRAYTYTHNGRTGIGHRLESLEVTDLIEYKPATTEAA